MTLRARVRDWLAIRHPRLWRDLDDAYIRFWASRRSRRRPPVAVRGDAVRGVARQSYRSTRLESSGDGAYVLIPPAGSQLGRHAVWRRVRTLERALGDAGADALAGAWAEPTDTDSAGPLFRADWIDDDAARWRDALDAAHRRGAWFAGRSPPSARPDVLFIPHNAYHTGEMARVAAELDRRRQRSLFCDITDHYHDEGARDRMRELGLPHTPYRHDTLEALRPGAVFVMNDWSGPPHQAVLDARGLGIPTLALVEGVQDFEDTHIERVDQKRHPYRHADTALLVGEFDRRFFTDHPADVTGSTRIEALAGEPRPTARRRLAVINSNFTYGVHTADQPAWLDAAVGACRDASVEFVISRHHADAGDFDGLPLSGRPLYDDLREAGVVISRFSGVLLEAMALDTPVIYFNPHGERVATFLNAGDAFPSPTTRGALAAAIGAILDGDQKAIAARQCPFFASRVSIDPERPSWVRIADAIEARLSID